MEVIRLVTAEEAVAYAGPCYPLCDCEQENCEQSL